MPDYSFQRLSKENFSKLVTLYKRAFGVDVSERILKQKYDTKNLGASHIGFIAFSENTPVAYYGVIPSIVRCDGNKILAAQSADTMTDPAHRKRGLFLLLAEKTFALARESGIEFIYGFPNEASYPGFIKLHWQFLPDPLQLFSFKAPLSITTLSNAVGLRRNTDKVFRSMQVDPARLFQHDTESSVVHDRGFIEYKKYNSTHFIDLQGSLLWIKADKNLKVGFASPAKNLSAPAFIRNVKSLASALGCRNVYFITHPSSPLNTFLKPAIQPAEAFKVGFYKLGTRDIDLSKLRFEYCDVDSF